jgi:hypothetical protein
MEDRKAVIARPLTPAQRLIVSAMYERDLVDYDLLAAAIGRSPRTVKMHVEQIALVLPGKGNPLKRVALYAERMLTGSVPPRGVR